VTGPPPELPPAESYLALFEDRALELQWALAAGDRPAATAAFRRLRETFGVGESALILSRLYLFGGMWALDCGNAAEAERVLNETLPHLERLPLRPDLWQAFRLLAACAARRDRPEQRDLFIRRADGLLTELAGSLSGEQRAVYGWNKQAAEEEALALEAARLAEEAAGWAGLTDAQRWRHLGRLHTFLLRLDEGRRELGRARIGRAAAPPAPTLSQHLEATPPDRAVLSFLVLPETVFACRACRGRLEALACPLPRQRLRDLVARWIESVSGRAEPARADDLADELACGLRLPDLLAGLPPEVRRLTVVPDDSLHGFPFAALRHRGRYLTEDYALSVAFDRSAPPTSPAGSGGGLLAVAMARGAPPSPEFPRGIPPLPGTVQEVTATAAWFRARGVNAVVLGDDTAEPAAVLDRWRDAAFVHLACHGVFRPDRPGASGLVFVPRADAAVILSLRNLSGVIFPRLRHVTLSNCWLADSFVLPGRTSVSLPEALCRAGAGSVLGCLWPVHDEAGALFMARFYEHAATLPRDEAVAAARRDVLGRQDPVCRGPLFWAGFQLYGDPGPLLG
jgi:hypothetical protein